MNDRGEYRTIFCSFGDDPDVHALSGDAVKLLLFLKLELPPTGIGIVYPSMYAEKMRADTAGLELIFQDLERPKPETDIGWIARQRNVVWIINALKFDLSLTPANKKKHVPYVHRLIAELDPKLDIVRAFKWHYKEWFPDAPKSNWKPRAEPRADRVSDRVSHTLSDRVSGDRVSHTLSIPRSLQEPDLTKQEHNSGDLGKERAAALPPGTIAFGRHFYGTASRDRVRDIKRQLRATLNGGAPIRKGVRVFAHSLERLEAKCREVIAEGVKDHDKAIVVLLKKLGDTSDIGAEGSRELPGLQEVDRVAGEERHISERLALAEAWLQENPELVTQLDREVDAEFTAQQAGADTRIDGPFRAMLIRTIRTAKVLKAWTDAGEPTTHPAGAR